MRLKTFFSNIFDWKFTDLPGYTMIDGVGGIFEAPDPQMPIMVTPYVTVADLGGTEAKITAAGGQIYKSKQEVPGRGWFTIFADPDGNVLALWQAVQVAAPKKARAAPKKAKKKPAKKKKARR
jgi:predicted enzyme related to lactoylglutathione lyase